VVSFFLFVLPFGVRWLVYRSLFDVRASVWGALDRPSFPFCCVSSVSVTLDRLSFPFCRSFLYFGHVESSIVPFLLFVLGFGHVGSSIVPFLLCVPPFGSRWIVHRSLFVVRSSLWVTLDR